MKLRYVSDDSAYIKLLQTLRGRQGDKASTSAGSAQGKSPYEDVVKLSGSPQGRTKLSERTQAGQELFHRVVNAYLKEAYAPQEVDVETVKARLRAHYGLDEKNSATVGEAPAGIGSDDKTR